jgi:hypothetical protein
MRILARISSSTYLDFKENAKYPAIFGQLNNSFDKEC